MNQTWIDQI